MEQKRKRTKIRKNKPSKSRRNASPKPVTSQFRDLAAEQGPEVPKRLRDVSVALAEVFLHPDMFDDRVAGEFAAQWKTSKKRVRDFRSTYLSLWQMAGNAPVQRELGDKVSTPQRKKLRAIRDTVRKQMKDLEQSELTSSGTPKRRQKRAK